MNDLRELWKDNGNGGDLLIEVLKSKSFRKEPVHSPLVKLKKNLVINLGYAVVITLVYAGLFFYFPMWQVQACLLLLIGFNLWAIYKAWELYNHVEVTLKGENVLSSLQKVYQTFITWDKQIQRIGLFIYPFAAAGGFMLGGTLGSQKSVENFMGDFRVQIVLGVAILVLVPLCYLLAKWLNKMAFGKYVAQIKERIDDLEGQE